MNLKGWDIVSFTPAEHLNRAIAENSEELSFDIKDGDMLLYGKLGVCSIVPGGGGKLLNLSFPVLRGTFESGGSQLKLDGCTAVFQVMMNFSDRITSQWKNAENNILDLTFDFSVPRYLPEEGKTRSFAEGDSGGIVTPLDLIGCSSVLRALILNLLTDFLISQRETFQKIIFANVILKGKQGNWLSPVLCRYSFLDGPVPYMAVLAVCSDRDISNLQLDVDVSGADLTTGLSYYAVSKSLFLKNAGIDCMTTLFVSSMENYTIAGDVLSNTCRVAMPDITVGAIDYSPYVETGKAQMEIQGSRLRVDLEEGNCSLYAGINMAWSSFNAFTCSFQDKKLVFSKAESSFHHSEDIPWYLRFIPLSFIIDICVACISDSLASGIDVKIDVSDAVLNDIKWYGSGIDIQSAVLNDGLLISY